MKQRKVIFTPLAARHIDRLYDDIATKAGSTIARGYVARLVAHCQKFGLNSERGTRRDYLLPGLRTVGFERRVTIAFVVTAAEVLIEGVFYGGQDYEARLRDRER